MKKMVAKVVIAAGRLEVSHVGPDIDAYDAVQPYRVVLEFVPKVGKRVPIASLADLPSVCGSLERPCRRSPFRFAQLVAAWLDLGSVLRPAMAFVRVVYGISPLPPKVEAGKLVFMARSGGLALRGPIMRVWVDVKVMLTVVRVAARYKKRVVVRQPSRKKRLTKRRS